MTESDAVSRTAKYMALFRALETARGRRALFSDPYARLFLPLRLRAAVAAARIPGLRTAMARYIDARWPGARSSGIARTWLIDRWVAEALQDGARQVVVLGAGFDCRALRLPSLAGIPVFEVDRAPLLTLKRRLLRKAGAPSHGHLVDVPMDFLTDDLGERLEAAGQCRGDRTLFLWEGVTNYLSAEAVSAVFDFLRDFSSPGSRIIFTYVHADVLSGTCAAHGLGAIFSELAASGEAWTFGFQPAELDSYLAARGLRLESDLGAADYRRLAMGKRARGLKGYEFYRVAMAQRVAPSYA